ncbi:hypothetical protein OAT47_03310, partial [Gammaproteobacteria bacterium]|nr:hypothetical protein [Gammaproteobacteria bacterium]
MNNFINISKNYYQACLFSLFLLFPFNFQAEEIAKAEEVKETPDQSSEEKKDKKNGKKDYKSIEDFIEDGEYKKLEGFLNILHETEKDKYYLIIEKDKLNKEFIYFTYVLNGPQAVGASGGSLGDGSILEFRMFKDDVGLYKINTKFTYDEPNKISQSKLTNIIEAFMGRFEVVVKEDDRLLISAD